MKKKKNLLNAFCFKKHLGSFKENESSIWAFVASVYVTCKNFVWKVEL